jgi:dTDP-4-amino-4,6-dideoxygalactose transaminase
MNSKLALLGGEKLITTDYSSIFKWPIITKEHENAVMEVLRAGKMSAWDITGEFEKEFAQAFESKYALAHPNGTMAILAGLYAMGIGAGDEVICPSLTYWASVIQLYSLGATPVFADIDPQSICIDPSDIEKCITKSTKAIIVVHYAGVPADMDRIMAIAKKHNLKIFEDCSHAHNSLYKGRQVGTFGDAAGFSLMTGKSFAIGEGGMLTTNSQEIYQKAILFGQYEKHGKIELPEIKKYAGLPSGGVKGRMHQLSSAFGRVQLKHYKKQFTEIDKAMTYFCDLIDQIPGIKAHRPAKNSGSTKGGWYFPLAHYNPDAFEGLSNARFAKAVVAEGAGCGAGCNKPLHTHPAFNDMDIYHHGKPTRLVNMPEGMTVSQIQKLLPTTEKVNNLIISLPWFKHYDKQAIEQIAGAYKKAADNYKDLLPGDTDRQEVGGYSSTFKK